MEYYPNGEDEPGWKVGKWAELSAVFTLEEGDLDAWHACLCGQGRPWLVVKRLYQVGALYGEAMELEVLETWDLRRLAEKEGVSEKMLAGDLAAAVEFWNKQRNVIGLKRVIETSAARDGGVTLDDKGLPEFRSEADLDEETVKRCLTAYRLDKITGADDRLFAARRVLELKKFLDEKSTREQARQLIFMEISLGGYETAMMAMKSRLRSFEGKENLTGDGAKEVSGLMKDLQQAEKAQTELSESHRKLAESLGEADIDEARLRRAALNTVGWWNEAIKEYHRDGTRKLVDGMFTAAELVWLTTPLSIRKAQYRPDIVIRAREAMRPENLWAPDYKPNAVEREAARRLKAIVEGLEEVMEPEEIEGIDAGGASDAEESQTQDFKTQDARQEEEEEVVPVRRVAVSPLQEPVSVGVMAGGGY